MFEVSYYCGQMAIYSAVQSELVVVSGGEVALCGAAAVELCGVENRADNPSFHSYQRRPLLTY